MKSLHDRLYSKLSPNGDCMEYTGYLSNGYGILKVDGKNCKAHRVSYELAYGPFDKSLVVRHKCDNTKCCNPEHLELGTQLDNVDDMLTRKRNYRKLSDNDIITIKDSKDPTSVLAETYGVTPRRILQLRNN